MFEPKFSYPYRHAQTQKHRWAGNGLLKTHIYVFHAKANHSFKYIVRFLEYEYECLVIDFYPKLNKDSRMKFRMLTNQSRPLRIVTTILKIWVDEFIKTRATASYGFAGASLPEEATNENSKRFRLYLNILNLVQDSESSIFDIAPVKENSTIFVINKESPDNYKFLMNYLDERIRENN